jgi:hypothetical protein
MSVGSSLTRDAEGTTVCPRSPKYVSHRRWISAVSIDSSSSCADSTAVRLLETLNKGRQRRTGTTKEFATLGGLVGQVCKHETGYDTNKSGNEPTHMYSFIILAQARKPLWWGSVSSPTTVEVF